MYVEPLNTGAELDRYAATGDPLAPVSGEIPFYDPLTYDNIDPSTRPLDEGMFREDPLDSNPTASVFI